MELKIDNATYWAECIGAVSNLIDEGLLKADKDGLSLKAMDASSISMVSFSMPSKAFSKYSVDKEESLGLDFGKLVKVLSRVRKGETLSIKTNGDKKVILEFAQAGSRRRMKMNLISIAKSEVKEPTASHTATLKINAKALSDYVKDISLVSSYLSFDISKDKQSIHARGDIAEIDEDFISEATVDKEAKAVFNLEFMQSMMKGCPSDADIELKVATNNPMRLSYNIGDAKLVYYLAPYSEE